MNKPRFFKNLMPDLAPGCHVPQRNQHWKEIAVDTASAVLKGQPATLEKCDGGLYVGCAGVAYMYYHMATSPVFRESRNDLLIRAKNYMDVSLSYVKSPHNKDPPAAFLLGSAGVYAVGAGIYHECGEVVKRDEYIRLYKVLIPTCLPREYLQSGSDELFVGRAGYLCGAIFLNSKFGEVIPREQLHQVCESIIVSGRHYARKHRSQSPLMYAYYGTEYLGAAHGLSAILQMLLHFPAIVDNNPEVQQAVDYLLNVSQINGNISPATDELAKPRPSEHELVHWCHGGPGVVYLFAKAYNYWKDDKYLQACMRIGELTWQKGLLTKGPGICHGVSGSAYVFLLLFRLTGDQKHLHRATKFAEFMQTDEFHKGARVPDSAFSLYEGLAGTVCFLTDLLQPQRAAFPFFDVF